LVVGFFNFHRFFGRPSQFFSPSFFTYLTAHVFVGGFFTPGFSHFFPSPLQGQSIHPFFPFVYQTGLFSQECLDDFPPPGHSRAILFEGDGDVFPLFSLFAEGPSSFCSGSRYSFGKLLCVVRCGGATFSSPIPEWLPDQLVPGRLPPALFFCDIVWSP